MGAASQGQRRVGSQALPASAMAISGAASAMTVTCTIMCALNGPAASGEAAPPQTRTRATAAMQSREKRSEEHTSELQSLMRISYAVFCLKKKKPTENTTYELYKQQTRNQ